MTVIAQNDWVSHSVPLLVLFLFGALAIVAVAGGFAVWRARLLSARTEQYQALVERMQADQQRVADSLAAVAADVAHVRARTEELERILRTVEQ